MKIYLSPSAQPHNAYAVGNTTEQVQCNRIAAAAKVALERNGYIVKKAPEGQSYVKNVAESNAWGADIHMPIHTNAGGNNKGTLGLCYKGCVNNKYMQAVYKAVAECTPWPDMGIGVRSDLYEINKTNMMCVYIECAFHDKADSAQWIINNVTALGEAIAKGFCAADGKTYIPAGGSNQKKTPKQVPGKRKSVWDFTKERMKGTGVAVAFVVLTTSILALLGVIQPVFSRIFLDRLLTGTNSDWLWSFLFALSALSLVMILMTWVSTVYSLKIQGKMAAVGSSSYLWKLLRLPMQFFDQRLPGDLSERQSTNASIAGNLVNTFGPLAINTLMMFFYLIVMLRYNVLLTLIGVSAIFINMFVSGIVTNKRINIQRVQMRDQSKLTSSMLAGINMIETIKASGAEKGYFGRIAGYQASVNAQQVRYAHLNQWLGIVPKLCTALANLTVLGYGVLLVLRGEFTIGMVMAFQALEMELGIDVRKPVSNIQFRLTLRTDTDTGLGTAWSDDIDFTEEQVGHRKLHFSMNMDMIAKGVFYASIGLYKKDEIGQVFLLDHITRAFKIEVSGSPIWYTSAYGNVALPKIEHQF